MTLEYTTSTFDPDLYIEEFYGDLSDPGSWNVPFLLDSLHDYLNDGSSFGPMLLDIGSGPCVFTVANAFDKVKAIHLSDYLEINRQVLQEWKQGKRSLHPLLFKYMLKKMDSNLTMEILEDKIREKVEDILFIDATKPNPLSPLQYTYDMITTSFCLDAVSHTVEEFDQVIKNVSTLLKVNGYFVGAFFTEESFYIMQGKRYKSLDITHQEIQDVFLKNGYEFCHFRYVKKTIEEEVTDSKGCFTLMAKKLK